MSTDELEIHGKMTLLTSVDDLSSRFIFGWLFSSEKDGPYDGFEIQVWKVDGSLHEGAQWSDVYDTRLSFDTATFMDSRAFVDHDGGVNGQNWDADGIEYSLTCPASETDSRCKVDCSFFRAFDTGDSQDLVLEEDALKIYESIGYF